MSKTSAGYGADRAPPPVQHVGRDQRAEQQALARPGTPTSRAWCWAARWWSRAPRAPARRRRASRHVSLLRHRGLDRPAHEADEQDERPGADQPPRVERRRTPSPAARPPPRAASTTGSGRWIGVAALVPRRAPARRRPGAGTSRARPLVLDVLAVPELIERVDLRDLLEVVAPAAGTRSSTRACARPRGPRARAARLQDVRSHHVHHEQSAPTARSGTPPGSPPGSRTSGPATRDTCTSARIMPAQPEDVHRAERQVEPERT